ncbi:MAG TPA: EscU/YscU/HrcU family type III secretion system export apparatus switch protein [Oscillatoriaceae cyanobacterium]
MAERKTPKRAIALRYERQKDEAPRVVATGQGLVAERMIEIAREHGVAVQENAELAEALSSVELGTVIPEQLYPVVAEVLVFVSRMNRLRGKDKPR